MPFSIKTIRTVLVDDHPVVREGLRAVMRQIPTLELVGEGSSGQEALELVSSLEPDALLIDLQLPQGSGIETIQKLKLSHPQMAIVVLTVYDTETYFLDAMRAGASGYVLKDSPHGLIELAIRAALTGGCLVPRRLMGQMVQTLGEPRRRGQEPRKLPDSLTPREIEVLRWLARGYQNREISAKLHLADVTVKKHLQSILAKLGAQDRTQAAIMGVRLGLAD